MDLLKARIRKLLHNINNRCSYTGTNKYERYGGRGIKNFLTKDDLTSLWKRDKADLMTHPSIDRIDSDAHYTFDNCRFIEFDQNRKNRYLERALTCSCGNQFFYHSDKNKHHLCPECRPSPLKVRFCKICQCPFVSSKSIYYYCSDCENITKPCAYCSTPITRSRGKDNTSRNNLWFCSKQEQGRWLHNRKSPCKLSTPSL